DPVRVQPWTHGLTEPFQHLDRARILGVEVDAALRAADREIEGGGFGGHPARQIFDLAKRAPGAHPGAAGGQAGPQGVHDEVADRAGVRAGPVQAQIRFGAADGRRGGWRGEGRDIVCARLRGTSDRFVHCRHGRHLPVSAPCLPGQRRVAHTPARFRSHPIRVRPLLPACIRTGPCVYLRLVHGCVHRCCTALRLEGMDLSLARLRMLRELHRRGTITAAATALHYTASAVSQQLAQLERDVGTRLLERRGRRVQLTDQGVLLAEHAEEILASVERATQALEEAQETQTVRLTAGVWASVASGLLPTALAALAEKHPGIEVRTRELAPEETPDAVRDGSLDFSFVIDYTDAPTPWDNGLERVAVAVERLHAALPAATAPGSTVSLSDLADQPWILASPRSHFGRAVRVACR